ncbi:MAG: putative competence protein [Chlamydiales bacterium]|jgi:competence protein ComEC|nr:putative competence protein [Chlamydiales bacterium]
MLLKLQKLASYFLNFWKRHLALFHALQFLLGTYALFAFHWSLFIPLIALWWPTLLAGQQELRTWFFKNICVGLSLTTTLLYFFNLHYKIPPMIPDSGIQGKAIIQIESIRYSSQSFKSCWIYQGTILSFHSSSQGPNSLEVARNIPYRLYLPDTGERPDGRYLYAIPAVLKATDSSFQYRLKVNKHDIWRKLERNNFSLSEWRFAQKQYWQNHLSFLFKESESYNFISGIFLGVSDSSQMNCEFSRMGLQHVMAISGLHFGIIANFAGLILRIIFPFKRSNIILSLLMTFYFAFIGAAPSVIRAWISAQLSILGHVLERQSIALNSLGLALGCITVINPLSCFQIGFQFSFIATAAILCYYNQIDLYLQRAWPCYDLSRMIEMNRLQQHGYVLLSLFRNSCSLMLAVHFVTIPLTLYYFQKLPFLSLFYNLFFPTLVGLTMIGTLISLSLSTVPLLGQIILSINEWWIEHLLNTVYQLPQNFDFVWYTSSIPLTLIVIFITICFGLAIYILEKSQMRQEAISWIY